MKTTVHHPINIGITESDNQAVVEYNILKELYPKFGNVDKCSVPRPLLVIPEMETYLMEFVPGSLVVDEHRYTRYFSSAAGFKSLKESYFHIGKLLKHFQEFTGMGKSGVASLDGVIERCDQRLKLVEESGDRRSPAGIRSRVMNYIERRMSRLASEEIMVCGRHGDFGPWNLLAGPQGITLIDFLGYRQEPLPVDIIKVLVYLEDEKYSLTSSSKRVELLIKKFLEGYGELPDIQIPVLEICETMQRVVSLWGSIGDSHNRIHHRIEADLRLKANLQWLLAEDNRRLIWPSAGVAAVR